MKQRADPELAQMQLLRRPQLSVQQVTPAEWEHILSLEDQSDEDETKSEVKSDEAESDEHKEQAAKTRAEIIDTHGG